MVFILVNISMRFLPTGGHADREGLDLCSRRKEHCQALIDALSGCNTRSFCLQESNVRSLSRGFILLVPMGTNWAGCLEKRQSKLVRKFMVI